jgi:integrase/recombinase XerD
MGHKEVPVTQLRKKVLEELERRNYSQATRHAYVGAIRRFAEYFHRSPEQLGPAQIREYQLHMVQRGLRPKTVMVQMAALRFLFLKVLRRRYYREDLPLPRSPRRQAPVVLSREEVARLIECASNLRHRTILMALYSTGMRRSELCHLRTEDIDKHRMVIHIRQGKGGKDRDVPLSPKLLEHAAAVPALPSAARRTATRCRPPV